MTVDTSSPLRIVVAEDAPLLRAGIVQVLTQAGMDVVAEVGTADELLRVARTTRCDVAVVDIRLPPNSTDDGLRAAIALRADSPGLSVLVLSQYLEDAYARELLGTGAAGVGYLLKNRVGDIDRFVDAVRQVGAGGVVLDPEIVELLLGSRAATATPLASLTDREREVVALMAEGRSNTAIARALHIGEASVEKHIRAIFTKLDLHTDPNTHRRVLAVLTYLQAVVAEQPHPRGALPN